MEPSALQSMINMAVDKEREECAKVVERIFAQSTTSEFREIGKSIAAAIRARKAP